MKTNDKKSLKSTCVNCRIVEIREAIEQIKIHLSEIEKSEESKSIRYMVYSETHDAKKYLELFEWQVTILSHLFD